MRNFIFILLLVGIIVSGCGFDSSKVTIEAAYAEPIKTTKSLGGEVEPDNFRIFAIVSTPRNNLGKAGDTFKASLSVGDASSISKYGSISGHKFILLTNGDAWITSSWYDRVVKLNTLKRRYYFAVADPAGIQCDTQNKLIFSVSGESSDDLRIHTSTVEMHGTQLLVKQTETPIGDMAYLSGKNSLHYYCGDE